MSDDEKEKYRRSRLTADFEAKRLYGTKPMRGPDGRVVQDDPKDDSNNAFSAFSNAVNSVGHAISSGNKALTGNRRPLVPWNGGSPTFPQFKIPRPIVY